MIPTAVVPRLHIRQSITIDAPVGDVHAQWTRFDWGDAVARRGIDWSVANVDAPDGRRLAWRCAGERASGVAEFEPLAFERTGVVLQLDLEPSTLLARFECYCGLAASAVGRELRRFQRWIEATRFHRAHVDEQRRELERFRSLIVDARGGTAPAQANVGAGSSADGA